MESKKINKYVLTGGPCCGKTSITDYLQSNSHLILPESARIILDARKEDGLEFNFEAESSMFSLQNELEKLAFGLANQRIFLDRSLIDYFAYSEKFFGKVPLSANKVETKNRYDLVFLLDRLPFKEDGIRIESGEAEAEKIHNLLEKTYLSHEYSPIKVPLFHSNSIQKSIAARAEFILKKVEEYENNK
jgi:predicted ATPase